jgi:hypothetical protein
MISLPRPKVILTHESDLDGLVSGILLQQLARKMFDEEVPLEAFHYHAWRQRSLNESSAWVCDFGFEKRLDKPEWLVVDHHPAESGPEKAQLIHDVTKSAGLLCYELCQKHGLGNERLDKVVHLNNVIDLFLEDDPEFVQAGDYSSLVKVYGFWNLHALINGDLEKLLDHPLLEVMETKRRVEDPIGYEWSVAKVEPLCSTVGFVPTVIGNTNQIVYRLLEEETAPYPVLVTLFRRANGMMILSLRSRNGEALKVATKLQGGGHPNACGATLPRSVRSVPEALDYLRRMLNPPQNSQAPLSSLKALFDAIDPDSDKPKT